MDWKRLLVQVIFSYDIDVCRYQFTHVALLLFLVVMITSRLRGGQVSSALAPIDDRVLVGHFPFTVGDSPVLWHVPTVLIGPVVKVFSMILVRRKIRRVRPIRQQRIPTSMSMQFTTGTNPW